MNKQVVILSCISLFLYTLLLFCFGIFGSQIQEQVIKYTMVVLKYGLIVMGYVMMIYLPYKITKQMALRKEKLYQIESDKKIQEIGKQKKELEEKILQEYYKSEDSI